MSVCLSVPSAHTEHDSPRAARDAASVHFRPSITKTDILVCHRVNFDAANTAAACLSICTA